jgi:foldase protein PrsA
MFLGPKIVVGLVDGSKIVLTPDEDIAPGKPLPAAAAIVDGHPIPMPEVVAKCLAESGPHTVDILVQNYIVDRECRQRGITVSEAEIDARVNKLRAQLAPHTIEEGLPQHHTTMAGLRNDYRQELERTKLVASEVKPGRMVHARAILVRANPPGMPMMTSGPTRSETEAKALLVDIQNQVRAGKDFEELATQFSEIGNQGGDVGILYEGMHNMDTSVLNLALAMKKGEMSPEPIKANDAYFILQAISTNEDHDRAEDAAYAAALASCREQKAQPMIPQAIISLIKKSKVVYYVHS